MHNTGMAFFSGPLFQNPDVFQQGHDKKGHELHCLVSPGHELHCLVSSGHELHCLVSSEHELHCLVSSGDELHCLVLFRA